MSMIRNKYRKPNSKADEKRLTNSDWSVNNGHNINKSI
jgi:hypothetical protein